MKTIILTISLFLSLFNFPLKSFAQLSDEEARSLIYMREEEKVAYDAYSRMFEKYNYATFQTIMQSEKEHMNKMKELIDKYNLKDPVLNEDQTGNYSNSKLQTLYNELMLAEGFSLPDALLAGARFEETDIVDLKDDIARTTDESILAVFNTLQEGSKNHLKLIVKDLKKEGINYKPMMLSKDEFESIMSSKN